MKVTHAKTLTVVFAAVASIGISIAPPAVAVPAPEVEYTYNVIIRRHFDFPANDAIGYGYGICEKVTAGMPYAAVMADVKHEVMANDESSANYVVLLCGESPVPCPDMAAPTRRLATGRPLSSLS